MVVSQVILSGIILELRVDQLVEDYGRTSRFNYDDAIMLPYWEVKKPSPGRMIIGHTY
jgi:hypothetical protein